MESVSWDNIVVAGCRYQWKIKGLHDLLAFVPSLYGSTLYAVGDKSTQSTSKTTNKRTIDYGVNSCQLTVLASDVLI